MGWREVSDEARWDSQTAQHCEDKSNTSDWDISFLYLYRLSFPFFFSFFSLESFFSPPQWLEGFFPKRYVCIWAYTLGSLNHSAVKSVKASPVQATPANTQHWPYLTSLIPVLLHCWRIGTLPVHRYGATPSEYGSSQRPANTPLSSLEFTWRCGDKMLRSFNMRTFHVSPWQIQDVSFYKLVTCWLNSRKSIMAWHDISSDKVSGSVQMFVHSQGWLLFTLIPVHTSAIYSKKLL